MEPFLDADTLLISSLLRHALLEIRYLARKERAKQAADLADAFHNLPEALLRPAFDMERLRLDLETYRHTYSTPGNEALFDYCHILDMNHLTPHNQAN